MLFLIEAILNEKLNLKVTTVDRKTYEVYQIFHIAPVNTSHRLTGQTPYYKLTYEPSAQVS